MSEGAHKFPSGINGLDLVLGGGLRFLERVPGAGESATILVRGAAGTGKTLLAMHIAAAVAERLKADVAVACIELLPRELEAQLAGFARTREMRFVHDESSAHEGSTPPRVFAQIVETAAARSKDPLGDEIVRLLDWVARCGGDARVLVVDSLSDGYGLGGKIARPAADALTKLAAERGLCLVLVEEVQRLTPTTWCFAVDTVLELRLQQLPDRVREDRTLTVTKNRYGPSDAGPHEVFLGSGVLRVLPEPEAWDRALAGGWWEVPIDALTTNHLWGSETLQGNVPRKLLTDFARSVTLVTASTPGEALRFARALGRRDHGVEIDLDLRALGQKLPEGMHGPITASPHRFLAALVEFVKARSSPDAPVSKVMLGDLSVLRAGADSAALRRVVAQFARWLHVKRAPLVLYETASPRLRMRLVDLVGDWSSVEFIEGWQPDSALGENVRIEVVTAPVPRSGQQIWTARPPLVLVHDLSTGRSMQWRDLPE